jgi:4-alpha-glucanotransferase
MLTVHGTNGTLACKEKCRWPSNRLELPSKHRIEAHKFAQFLFFRQWFELKSYCNKLGIKLIGDIPIFVAQDSSDVWTNPDQFKLDEDGTPTVVAGVPPDYFSTTGQLWGNPIYNWDPDVSRRIQMVDKADQGQPSTV